MTDVEGTATWQMSYYDASWSPSGLSSNRSATPAVRMQRLAASAEEVAFNDPPGGAAERMILNDHLWRLLRHSKLSAFQRFIQGVRFLRCSACDQLAKPPVAAHLCVPLHITSATFTYADGGCSPTYKQARLSPRVVLMSPGV